MRKGRNIALIAL